MSPRSRRSETSLIADDRLALPADDEALGHVLDEECRAGRPGVAGVRGVTSCASDSAGIRAAGSRSATEAGTGLDVGVFVFGSGARVVVTGTLLDGVDEPGLVSRSAGSQAWDEPRARMSGGLAARAFARDVAALKNERAGALWPTARWSLLGLQPRAPTCWWAHLSRCRQPRGPPFAGRR